MGVHVQTQSSPGPTTHRVAERDRWPWLPLQRGGHLLPHPFCKDCGLVKFVGTGRAMDLGGLVNLLSKLERSLRDGGLRLTEAQRRLILQRVQSLEMDDQFGLSRDAQLALLSRVIGQYLQIHPPVVESYLRSC